MLLSPYVLLLLRYTWQLLLRRVAEEATVLGQHKHQRQYNHQEDGGRGGDARAPTAAGLPFCVCLQPMRAPVSWRGCRPKQPMDDALAAGVAGAAEAEALLRRLAADPDAAKLLGGQAVRLAIGQAAETQVR
eukprot:COSAG01_NODE_12686_length_1700_cov_1.657714_2_plen_132_part_00